MQTSTGNLIQGKASDIFSLSSSVAYFVLQDIGEAMRGSDTLDLIQIKIVRVCGNQGREWV